MRAFSSIEVDAEASDKPFCGFRFCTGFSWADRLSSDHRRSATLWCRAVRCVADHRIELGTEVARYHDLADRDERAIPTPVEPRMMEAGATQVSGPALPCDPASTTDTIGHSVFQQLLSDIAATDFRGDELTRLQVLSLIDQVWVGHRANSAGPCFVASTTAPSHPPTHGVPSTG